ncbi:motility protein A [Salinibacter ruber]|uniref:motility protein A n=1 Tax=Salinibacter ruber TaxID=146919 RepID=UPI00216A41AC|nr:MotA/TolQ/ExbB proton channel family protein [Salinibacter ruber]MCS4199036.1 chemotaxis protein MotA [Salinibacter ruber]
MRKSTSIGLISGFALIVGAILLGNTWGKFFDPASLLMVVGGTAAAVVVNYSFEDLKRAIEMTQDLFTFEPPSLQRRLDQITNMARTARREGVLALDRHIDDVDDDLLEFGLEMAVDGMGEDEIAGMLDQRIAEMKSKRQLVADFFTQAGTYAPAFGMIGTLIGLIQMLNNLDDPSKIGSGMATALITTFYGALLANLAFLPLGDRARKQNELRGKAHYITREGILAIARGDSPRMIEQRLGFLAEDEIDEEAEDAEAEDAGAESTEDATDAQPAAAAA